MNIIEYPWKWLTLHEHPLPWALPNHKGLEKPSRSPPRLEERLRSERARERQLQEDMERQMPSWSEVYKVVPNS